MDIDVVSSSDGSFRNRSGASHARNPDDTFCFDFGRDACRNSIGPCDERPRRQGRAADFQRHVTRYLGAGNLDAATCWGSGHSTNTGSSFKRVDSGHAFAGQWFADCLDPRRRAACNELQGICEGWNGEEHRRDGITKLRRHSPPGGGSPFGY